MRKKSENEARDRYARRYAAALVVDALIAYLRDGTETITIIEAEDQELWDDVVQRSGNGGEIQRHQVKRQQTDLSAEEFAQYWHAIADGEPRTVFHFVFPVLISVSKVGELRTLRDLIGRARQSGANQQRILAHLRPEERRWMNRLCDWTGLNDLQLLELFSRVQIDVVGYEPDLEKKAITSLSNFYADASAAWERLLNAVSDVDGMVDIAPSAIATLLPELRKTAARWASHEPREVVTEEQRVIFKQLRQSFESLGMKSRGLYHVLVERQQSRLIPEVNDKGIPPVIRDGGPPGDPQVLLASDALPGDPHRPISLTEEERASAPPRNDDAEHDGFIRDKGGSALAKWLPAVVRDGMIRGDHDVLGQFQHVAEATGQALLGLSDDAVSRLPDSIRPLCRPALSRSHRYVFGTVPKEALRMPWMAQGWIAGGAAFDGGVIVDNPEAGTGTGSRSGAWLLLLHRLGWEAKPGVMPQASRWYWFGNYSVAFDYPLDLDVFPSDPKVPRSRFYSVLSGSHSRNDTDVCLASAWAIDRLLAMLS